LRATAVTSQDEMRRLGRYVELAGAEDDAFATFATAEEGRSESQRAPNLHASGSLHAITSRARETLPAAVPRFSRTLGTAAALLPIAPASRSGGP